MEEGNGYIAFDDETNGKGALYGVGWVLEVEMFGAIAPEKREIHYAKYFKAGLQGLGIPSIESPIFAEAFSSHVLMLAIRYDPNFPWSASLVALDMAC